MIAGYGQRYLAIEAQRMAAHYHAQSEVYRYGLDGFPPSPSLAVKAADDSAMWAARARWVLMVPDHQWSDELAADWLKRPSRGGAS